MSKRIHVGHLQYGAPHREKKYLSRIRVELKAYQKSGNAEHLVSIANYCWLETEAPQHPKYHFDNSVDSVTRGKV